MSSSKPTAQPSAQPSAQSQPNAEAAAMELMKPGPEHAYLDKKVGTWKVAYTHWMKEGAEPIKATGTATFTRLFDGRYVREDFSGEFAGKPFNGVGTTGYDRAAKQFVNTWYDSMGTGILYTTGPAVGAGKELVLRGSMTCPTQGRSNVRHVYAHDSDDRFTLTMFNERDGKESKAMEVVYTRQR